MFLLSALVCIGVVAFFSIHAYGLHQLKYLKDLPPADGKMPVSIIVAARNEQKNIEEALRSLLHLDYKLKEVIVVNDRSTDATGSILERIRNEYSSLRIVTIDSLPAGWLGKNHAQFSGARVASGDVFLFTDADVVMHASSLSRAVNYFESRQLDHLAILPTVDSPGVWLNAIVSCFEVFFDVFTRAWSVENPKSRAFVGVGAFTLIRRNVYERIGTHEAIRLRPDDDMRLGKLVKKHGFKQGFLVGIEMLRVEWYDSVGGLIQGLMKNSFSATNYHLSLIALGSVAMFLISVWPYLGWFISDGHDRLLYGLSSILLWAMAIWNARSKKKPLWYGTIFPAAMMLMIYIVWKASLQTLIRGGINWRGTFTSLKDLRSNNV